MLDFLHEKKLTFQGSILGLGEYDEFSFATLEQEGPYGFLQSITDDNIGFLVVTPFQFFPEYTFEIEEKDKKFLVLEKHDDVAVLTIVTIHEPFEKSTVNLLAPLIINVKNGKSRQIVLPPKSSYGTKEVLFKEAVVESGE